MISPLFRFFFSFILGATLLILISACGGNSDEDWEEDKKTTQPIQCTQCRK